MLFSNISKILDIDFLILFSFNGFIDEEKIILLTGILGLNFHQE